MSDSLSSGSISGGKALGAVVGGPQTLSGVVMMRSTSFVEESRVEMRW